MEKLRRPEIDEKEWKRLQKSVELTNRKEEFRREVKLLKTVLGVIVATVVILVITIIIVTR